VRLEIDDDGVGFDLRDRSDGLGLAGMAARAERLGGSVSVESAPGRGTLVAAELPTTTVDAAEPEQRSRAVPGCHSIAQDRT
jgi:signal transduction histidine kinase